VIRKVLQGVDDFLSWFAKIVGEPATSFCEIETIDPETGSLVASDGSLATVIRLHGSARLVGAAEFGEVVSRLSNTLSNFLAGSGHSLQVYWARDPAAAADQVREVLAPARAQARNLELTFEDLLDEKEREIARWVTFETVCFVLWTHPSILTPAESKSARAQQKVETEPFSALLFSDAQNPRVMLSALRNRHAAYASSIRSELRELGLVAEQLDAHDALHAMRFSVDAAWSPRDWRACIPGDKIPVRFPMRSNETSAVWWPPLASQVWPRDAKVLDGRFLQVGDLIHAPMYVERPSARIEPFDRLLQRTMNLEKTMPWSVSILLHGGGLKQMSLKSSMAGVLAALSADNALLRDAARQLKDFSNTGSVCSMQIVFNTWAPVGKMDLLRQRASRMAQAMIDWGGCEVREVTGDPVEGFTCSALGLSSRSIATVAAAPVMDVIPMLPLTRPASPWVTGAELFTSPDGKLMPYQPGSSLQTTWISLFAAGPGAGKSVQMTKQHVATILAPSGLDTLPPIAIIDIGPSSSGLYSLLYNALPASKRHQVNCYRLRNTVEFACNPFDLQLGCMYPLPEERSFLVDLLTMVVTPAETGVPYEGTVDLAGMVIDEMYTSLENSTRGNPHRYDPGVDLKVDEAIMRYSIDVPNNGCWYEVRDLLFAVGATHEAHLAQRHAVPVLSDAASAARSNTVRDVYGRKFVSGEGSETLPEAFSRMIQAACREYKILSMPTRFDLGESRVTIMDLDEVAKSGGAGSAKQTAIMYALAMYMLTRQFTLTQDNLRDMPAMYNRYHYPRVQALAKELKTLHCDEFHRMDKHFSPMIRNRVKVLGREGRKLNIQVMLGSQRMSDFDDELIDMATSVYIMEVPGEGMIAEYASRFGLSSTEQIALRAGLRGPQAGGAQFFARMKLKEGNFNQLLKNPAGPIELWACSTTAEDKDIRQMVYEALGPVEGRMALAQAYPGGSAKRDCDARKAKFLEGRGSFSADIETDLYAAVAREICDAYKARQNARLATEVGEQERRRTVQTAPVA
jgi:intracellular multiplication protein IcmB